MFAKRRSSYKRHDIYAVTRKYGEVRMVPEQLCGGISGFSLDDQIAAEWIHGFSYTAPCHTRCFAHHTTAIKDERSIPFLPRRPLLYAHSIDCILLGFGQASK